MDRFLQYALIIGVVSDTSTVSSIHNSPMEVKTKKKVFLIFIVIVYENLIDWRESE